MTMSKPLECFGEWDGEAKECKGGYDAGFVGPNGSQIRPQCPEYHACKLRTQVLQHEQRQKEEQRRQEQQRLIPPAALHRPLTPQTPSAQPSQATWHQRHHSAQAAPSTAPATAYSQQQQQKQGASPPPPPQAPHPPYATWPPPPWGDPQANPYFPYPYGAPGPYMPPPYVYPGNFPVHGNIDPIKMIAVNYGMPAYLSVPEPRDDGFWPALGRELFRSMGKALGHSIAHFFDTVTMRRGR